VASVQFDSNAKTKTRKVAIRKVRARTSQARYSIVSLNELKRREFVRVVGPVFERSPWVSERTWPGRPFARRAALHRALCATVAEANARDKLQLIRAHPDLGERSAGAVTLTRASAAEQARAGLDRLGARERSLLQQYNRVYRRKFGFPFVICARRNNTRTILAAIERRLRNPRNREIRDALEQIFKIADLRLRELIAD
jgi:2-oxo-4-hydroxy-4-carboxy-5-ureidoimidazoline decarboxylase